MNELDQAQDEIRILQADLVLAKTDNEHHIRQRGIDSERIDDLEGQLGLARVELQDGDTISKLTVGQHAELIAKGTSALQVRVKELENDLDVARETNKHLHNQIDALKTGGLDDDSLLAEQHAGLQAAEKHRKRLEEENEALVATVASQGAEIVGLKHRVRDLRHQPVAG